jgi:hypothetical protein
MNFEGDTARYSSSVVRKIYRVYLIFETWPYIERYPNLLIIMDTFFVSYLCTTIGCREDVMNHASNSLSSSATPSMPTTAIDAPHAYTSIIEASK